VTHPAVGVVGAGRAGQGLALALHEAGYSVRLYGRRWVSVPAPLTLDVGSADRPPPWVGRSDVILLAVRDDALPGSASVLATAVTPAHVVLHLSGSQGLDALDALRSTGAAIGSLHPLQTLVDPLAAPVALRGARAAVEGEPRARAAADQLARALGMVPFEIAGGAKALYHAAAVFASNYLVACAGVGTRLLEAAGAPADQAWPALRPLVEGTLRNLLAADAPGLALTGPVARGDVATVARHVDALTTDDLVLYTALGRAALEMIEDRLDPATVAALRSGLRDDARAGRR